MIRNEQNFRQLAGGGVALLWLHRLLVSDSAKTEMRDFLTSKHSENCERLLPLLQGLADKSYSLANDLERGSSARGVEKLVGRDGLKYSPPLVGGC